MLVIHGVIHGVVHNRLESLKSMLSLLSRLHTWLDLAFGLLVTCAISCFFVFRNRLLIDPPCTLDVGSLASQYGEVCPN